MPISAQDFFGSPITPAKREAPWSLASTTPQKPVKLPEGSLLPPDPEMRAGLEEAASRHKVNPALLMALAQQESTYNPSAVGVPTKWGRASGMFQFLDSTAKGHGIDPLDWKQSADAAAKDLAEQIAKKGVDWAIAHHHGGPNPKQHGPKTREYAREVLAKAQVIAKELGITIDVPDEQNPDFSNVVDTPTPDADSFFGAAPVKGEKKVAAAVGGEQEPEGLFDTAKRLYGKGSMQEAFEDIDILAPVRRTVARGWEGIQDFINRETVEVERTDEELRRIWDANPSFVAAEKSGTPGITFADWAKQNRKVTVTAQTAEEDEAKWAQRLAANPEDAYLLPKRLSHLRPQADDSRFADKHSFTGFMQRVIANHKNPLDLMLQDSIPANIVTGLFNLPEQERKKFDQARQITQALEITNNPEGKSAEEVEQAQAVVGEWKKGKDKTIVESWNELFQAARDDPASVAVPLSEAIFADPELLAAPAGVGVKLARGYQAARVAATGQRTTSIARRAAKIADRVLDAAGTTAAVNVAAGAASNFATEGEVNTDEVKMNAAIGVLFGGTIGALFAKGARAKSVDLDKAKLQGTYEDILRDRAEADVELESQVRKAFEAETPEEARVVESAMSRAEFDRSQRFAELMGIRNSKDQAAWIAQRRKEVKATFKNESDYADYQRFVAEERVRRSEELAASAEARRREAAGQAELSAADQAAKRQSLQEGFDTAIITRNAAEESQDVAKAAQSESEARVVAEQLNAEELYDALTSGDSYTVNEALDNVERRNGQLRVPKGQAGEIDPQLLARAGVAGAGAAAGFALFPEDQKLQGTLLGGLAGLVIPAGGSVLSRLRQSGAIAGDGQIIAAMVKAGKLANKLDEVELKARDSAWVERVRTGDQKAFQNLYETYFPKIKRFANKYMNNRETATGLDAEDVAQLAFTKVYQKLVDEPDFEIDNFPAFVTRVAENEALQAIRKSQSQREGANVINESTVRRFDDEGNELSGRSIMDTTTGLTDEGKMVIAGVGESAEHAAQVAEFTDILRQAFDGMSKNMQDAMTAVHFENFTPEEAAKQLGLTYDNVRQLLSRGETLVRRSIEENRRKFGEPAAPRSQRGSADIDTMQKTALITAAATAGGTAGYFLYDGDPWKTAVLSGMGAAAVALTRGKGLTKALRGIDYRMRDFGPTLYGLAKKHGYQELKDIRKYNNETANFITQFGALPEKVKPVLIRALSTRDKVVINKMLEHVGGKKFVEAFDKVRKTLDEIEDQLVGYGLIKKSEKDYFPFRVKDLEGLRTALGKEAATEIEAALKNAERKAQETMGRPLNEIERGVVINKILEPYLGKTLHSTMPGFAKARTIQEIPERLQKFYFDPIETLNSYGVQSVKYIERAKFFGRNLVKRKEGNQEFVDIDKSVGQLVDSLRTKGELNDQQAFELAEILRDRFGGGERTPHPYIQGMKNLVNASLLGHISSAATQLGDLALQGLLHGPRSSAKALFRQVFRKKQLDLSDFGLNEHVAHEFLSDNWTRKVSDWSFKWGGFRAIDATGKNFGLNSSVDKMMRLAKTVEGERKLADIYQRYFPEDYSKALTALKKGQINESVELLAFTDLTQTQPLTQWELPQYYHKFPNGRVLYHLQTFSIRVMNMVYERSVKDLVSGDKKRFAKGARNLIAIGTVLGVQGVGTDKIKDMIAGRPVELKPEDVPVNALEALGMSMYDYNRIADNGPLKGLIDSKLPPIIRISDDLLNEPERAIKNVPVVGRLIYDRNREAFEARRRKRRKEQGYKMEITVKPASEKKDSSGGRRD
jgi:RNA polymerase sigma factor (sigma-70 family)